MEDIKIENSSKATKDAVRRIALGEQVKTVGSGGDFSTLSEAVAWHNLQPQMELLIPAAGYTVSFDRGSNEVTGSEQFFGSVERLVDLQQGDLMHVTTDRNPYHPTGGLAPDEHYYVVHSAGSQVYDVADNLFFKLTQGILGPSKTNYAASFYRPIKYLFLLLPQVHLYDRDATELLKAGSNFMIGGFGHQSILKGTDSFSSYIKTEKPYGIHGMQSIHLNYFNGFIHDPADSFLLGESTQHMITNSITGRTCGKLNPSGAGSCVAENIMLDAMLDHGFGLIGDYVRVNNLHLSNSESSDLGGISNLNTIVSTTWKKSLSNSTFKRLPANPYRSNIADIKAQHLIIFNSTSDQGLVGTSFDLDIINCHYYDNFENDTGSQHRHNMKIVGDAALVATGVPTNINIINTVMEFKAPHEEHIMILGGDNLNLNLLNSFDQNGAKLTTVIDDATTPTIVHKVPQWQT